MDDFTLRHGGGIAEARNTTAHVENAGATPPDVRFRGQSGHRAVLGERLLMTQSGHLTACDPDRGDNDIHASLSKRFRRLIRETQDSGHGQPIRNKREGPAIR